MLKIEDLKELPIVGNKYWVPCLDAYYLRNKEWIQQPILLPGHTCDDTSFIHHYHIDLRFTKNLKDLVIFSIIEECDADVTYKKLKCIRNVGFSGVIHGNLQKQYADQKVINNKCPHKGAYLGNCSKNKHTYRCPMHGLQFCTATDTVMSNIS